MNVTIVSCFRDSSHYIDLYFHQVQGLYNLLCARGDHLSLLLGYGDSTDGTGEMLFEAAQFNFGARLVDVSHGGPLYGSVENAQRFKQLATMGNKLLDCVPPDADVVGIVESDLIWDALTLSDLIAHTAYVPAIAPMIMDGPHSFYDVYAFRRNGQRFTKTPPYHECLDGCCDLVQLDSAGSVLFVRGDLAKQARFTESEAIVGYSKDIYRHGGSIWLDPALSVQHPVYA
jgi:hypothetical protein